MQPVTETLMLFQSDPEHLQKHKQEELQGYKCKMAESTTIHANTLLLIRASSFCRLNIHWEFGWCDGSKTIEEKWQVVIPSSQRQLAEISARIWCFIHTQERWTARKSSGGGGGRWMQEERVRGGDNGRKDRGGETQRGAADREKMASLIRLPARHVRFVWRRRVVVFHNVPTSIYRKRCCINDLNICASLFLFLLQVDFTSCRWGR